MTDELTEKSTAELQDRATTCRDVLDDLFSDLQAQTELNGPLQRLVRARDMLETFSELAEQDPGTMRMVLQLGIAVLVNQNSVRVIEAELSRRAAEN